MQLRYEANAAPDNSCKGPVSGNTNALSGLTNNTSYIYTAYSDDMCSTALASAAVSTYLTLGNLDKPVYLESCRVSRNTHCAVGFTTGGNSGGYTISEITAKFKTKTGSPGNIIATLHSSTTHSQKPGNAIPADASLATLAEADSNPDNAGDYKYTCSPSANNNYCSLSPGTTYFMQFTTAIGMTSSVHREWASADSNDYALEPTGKAWTLANGTDYHIDGRQWLAEYAGTGLLLVSATAN